MEYCRMFLLVCAVVLSLTARGPVNGDCTSDIQNCAGGGSATSSPGDPTALSTSMINTVCANTASINNAISQAKCIYTTIQTPACSSQYGSSVASNLPPIDWNRVLDSYMYACANKDAFVRATTCVLQYANDPKSMFVQCSTNIVNSITAALDRSKSLADQALQMYCSLEKKTEETCLTTALLPNCQAGDLEVVKTATVKALPPACVACGLQALSIWLIIFLSVLSFL